ncbi:MAG: preprotein translocase subunit SecG [Clostridia bacterium]|nr:preprotein translocase subunit SecG [Clostridia bacterium]
MLTALIVVLVICALGLIASVLLQSGRSAGLSGAVAGASEQIFGKRRGLDQFLARLTVIFAVAFGLAALAITVVEQ